MAPPLGLEIAIFSANSGLLCQQWGARRVELNAPGSYDDGGLTPPVPELIRLAPELRVPIRIMIRPRGAPKNGDQDFIYSDDEFETMKQAILAFKNTNLLNPLRGDGFVFGVLEHRKRNNEEEYLAIDILRCRILIELARPYGCVFHRAFDPVAETDFWKSSIDELVHCGFEGLLTAGGLGNCTDNLDRLVDICLHAAGRLQIVLGGGVRSYNAESLIRRLPLHSKDSDVWVHSAALAGIAGRMSEQVDCDSVVCLLTAIGGDTVG